MIRPSIRIASTIVSLTLCYLGGLWFAPALLFALPLFMSWNPPTDDDREVLDAELSRYRGAMFICFVVAYLMLIVSVTWPGAKDVASLGMAVWVVAFLLLFPTAYYASRRAMLRDQE